MKKKNQIFGLKIVLKIVHIKTYSKLNIKIKKTKQIFFWL